ncbi:MAG: hypothetical protein E7362_01085 [Clostridiales bacterium]|nr:hypothetical protein [Clostridiales bacterium]
MIEFILIIAAAALSAVTLITVAVTAYKTNTKLNSIMDTLDENQKKNEQALKALSDKIDAANEPDGEIVKVSGYEKNDKVYIVPRVSVERVGIEPETVNEDVVVIEREPIVEKPVEEVVVVEEEIAPVVEEPTPAEEVVEEVAPVEEPAPVVEEPVEDVVVLPEETAKEEPVIVIDETPEQEEIVVSDVENQFGEIHKIPFATKLLGADDQTQIFYDTLNNEFNSYRKLHIRISAKCVSYRLGRDLVAKITYRGKTMKLHLALDVNAYPENIYFQKDESDVKAYEEVPFTVKVKSERGLKRAIALIEALASEKGMEKKAHWNAIDSIADLREWQK